MTRSIITLSDAGKFAGTFLINGAGTSVQLRQTVTGDGIIVKSGNGHNDAFIQMPERHLAARPQTRTVLMPVPTGTTIAEAQAAVDAFNATGATLWFRTSDDINDILGANQIAGIASGKSSKTLAQYAHDLRMPTAVAEDGTVTYSQTHFRGTFFSRVPKDDVDVSLNASVAAPAGAVQLEQTPAVAAVAAQKAPF